MSDSSIDITTSQNVIINYETASLGDRILASVIDDFVKGGYMLIVIFIIYVLSQISRNLIWVSFIFVLPVIFYSLIFEIAMQGQTPGKRSRNIKVVKMDGGQASVGAYLIRWLFRIIEVDFLYGIIAMLTIGMSKKRQRVGDMLAQTVVINVKERVTLQDTLYEKVQSNYMVQYDEVKRLNDEDIELIKKVLNTPEYRNNFEMVLNLTLKIQGKMGLIDRKQGPEDFLETVTRDYNYLCAE